jgi:hypothetical protein
MRDIRMSFAQSREFKPLNPERTAYRSMGGLEFDIIFKEFTNRQAMLKTIELQGKREFHITDWKPCIKPDNYNYI